MAIDEAAAKALLGEIESKLERGDADVGAMFAKLGLDDPDMPLDSLSPDEDWPEEVAMLFQYVRGNYGLGTGELSLLRTAMEDFEEVHFSFEAHDDTRRAARSVARALRAAAHAESSVATIFEKLALALTWREDKELQDLPEERDEVDLSILEMLTLAVRNHSESTDPDDIKNAFSEHIRPALQRLVAQPPRRQQATVYADLGFWLAMDEVWPGDELEEVEQHLGVQGRKALRKRAYEKACELEDGSYYRVGPRIDPARRKAEQLARHQKNLSENS